MIVTFIGNNGGFIEVSRVHGLEISVDRNEAVVRHAGKFTKITGLKFVHFGILDSPENLSTLKESKESFEKMETFDMSSNEQNTGVKKI